LPNSPHVYGDFRIPFVYATNGSQIYTCDLRDALASQRLDLADSVDALPRNLGVLFAQTGLLTWMATLTAPARLDG
jgi:type I site-specific restriction endonuclease